MRVNASRSRDRARAGAAATSPASSMRSGARSPSIVTRHKLETNVPPDGIVDDGAAVSRPCQGIDETRTAASSAGGEAAPWRAIYRVRPEPHRNPASLPGPHRKSRRRRTRGAGRRAKRPASNRHGSSSRQSAAARRRLRRKPGKCLAVPCRRGAGTGPRGRSSAVRSSRPPATSHPVTSPVNRRL